MTDRIAVVDDLFVQGDMGTSTSKIHNDGRSPQIRLAVLLFAVLLAGASVIALSVHVDISGSTIGEKIKATLPMEGGQGVLGIILAIWFYHLMFHLDKVFTGKVGAPVGLSVFLAICMVMGRSLNALGNLSFVTSGLFYVALSLVCLIGFMALLAPVFGLAFGKLDQCVGAHGVMVASWERWQVFFVSLTVILLCWLPYIVVGFPGTTSVDFIQQLRQFFGATELTNHHPYLMTLFFGTIFDLGSFLGGSSNAGLAAVSLFQTAAMAATFAWVAMWMTRIGCRRGIIYGIVGFCSLCPLFPMFAQWCVKDTLSAILMIHFVMQIGLRLYCRHESYSSIYFSWPAIIATGVLCALSRNNCAYVVIPTLVVLAIVLHGRQKLLCLLSTALTVLLIGGWQAVLLPSLGIKAGSISEALSLPLLQTTRCIELCYDSLDSCDKDSLQAPCSVPIEELPEYYSVQISDQVKARYKFEGSELADYIKTYIVLGLRYPGIYTNVALAKTFGYWYPAATDEYTRFWYEYAPYTTSIMSPSLEADLVNDRIDLSEKVYEIHSVFPEAKTEIRRVILDVANSPLGMLVFSAACYVWICLTLCIYQISRRKPTLILIVPILLMIVICCISPLNGSIRYALPLVCLAPLLLGFAASPSGTSLSEDVGANSISHKAEGETERKVR